MKTDEQEREQQTNPHFCRWWSQTAAFSSLIFLSVLYVTFSLFSFMLAQEVQLIHTCHLKKVCQVSWHNHGGVKETPGGTSRDASSTEAQGEIKDVYYDP